MKNGVKNGKNTQFTSENQPSAKSKSEGWKRRKESQIFMDKILEYQELTVAEFEKIEKKIEKNKNDFTVRDLMALKYVSKSFKTDKFLIDWMDRLISKAQFNKEDEKDEDKINQVFVEIFESEYNLEELEKAKEMIK